MKIISLDINNFGKFSNQHFDFSSGLNFFIQENAWGKSTLATFIKAMFYGLDYNRKNDFNDRKHYFPWNAKNPESLFGGSMEIEFKNQKYKIVRFFGQKKSQDIFKIYDLQKNLLLENFSQEPGIYFFGLDKESFERSAFINSDKQFSPQKTDSINAKLNNLIQDTNENVNFQNAKTKLDDVIKKFSSTRANFAIIPNLENQILNLDEKILIAEENEKKFLQNQKTLEEEKTKCNKINDILKKLDEQKIIFAQNSISPQEKSQLEKLDLKFKDKNLSPEIFSDLENKLNELEELWFDFAHKPWFDFADAECFDVAQQTPIEAHQTWFDRTKGRDCADFSKNKKSKTQKILTISFSFLSLFSFVSFIITSLFYKFQNKNFQILSFTQLALGILFFIFVIIFFVKKSNLKNCKSKNQQRNLQKRIFALQNELLNFINSFQSENQNQTKNLGFELNSILNDYKNFTNLKLKQNKILELEKKYKINFEEIFSRTKILEEEKISLEKNINLLENENKNLENFSQEKIILENQKLNLQNELKSAQKKLEVLENTKKFLEEANENLSSNYFQKMNLAFRKYFFKIAKDSVSQKIIFNSDLKVNIENEGLLYNENFLSSGFSELANFCTKLALVDCMFEKEKPCLILDEAFSNLDDEKTQKALNLLREISREYQIIYFSCHKINRSFRLSK